MERSFRLKLILQHPFGTPDSLRVPRGHPARAAWVCPPAGTSLVGVGVVAVRRPAAIVCLATAHRESSRRT